MTREAYRIPTTLREYALRLAEGFEGAPEWPNAGSGYVAMTTDLRDEIVANLRRFVAESDREEEDRRLEEIAERAREHDREEDV